MPLNERRGGGTGRGTGVGKLVAGIEHDVPVFVLLGTHTEAGSEGLTTGGGALAGGAVLTACANAAMEAATAATAHMLRRMTNLTLCSTPANHPTRMPRRASWRKNGGRRR